MTVERLSALDASFLAVETPAAPMHVGWVSTYDLPEDGSRPRFPELFEHLAGRFAHAPRWRRKLAPVPLGITEPAWADDPDFDPAQHLLHARGLGPRRDRRRDLLRAAPARPPAVADLDRRRARRTASS